MPYSGHFDGDPNLEARTFGLTIMIKSGDNGTRTIRDNLGSMLTAESP